MRRIKRAPPAPAREHEMTRERDSNTGPDDHQCQTVWPCRNAVSIALRSDEHELTVHGLMAEAAGHGSSVCAWVQT